MKVTIEEHFKSLYWHDAHLLSVYIDRSKLGVTDEVHIGVEWPDDSRNLVIFEDVLTVEMTLNFFVRGHDPILAARYNTENEKLRTLFSTFKDYPQLIQDLQHFQIEPNTTAGVINIFAKSFRLTEYEIA